MTTESTPTRSIEDSIEIDAPPARVWEVVSEVRNATQWSSQAWKILPLGGRTTKGTWALNLNKRGPIIWPTTSRVVEFEPGERGSGYEFSDEIVGGAIPREFINPVEWFVEDNPEDWAALSDDPATADRIP